MKNATNDDLYAAMVAVLAKQLEAEQKQKGVQRTGGYEHDALRVIEATKRQLGYS